MTFSEFFLAYKLAALKQTDLIFMDRSLSNMYSSLLAETSKKNDWKETSCLLNYELDGVSFDENDFTLARYNVLNETLKIPPCRGDYLRYSIFFKILEIGSLNFDNLCSYLEVDSTIVLMDVSDSLRPDYYGGEISLMLKSLMSAS
jgi:hypothetical protein